jgi:serine/threonine protein kinase/TolB-like protein/tetratricopeptide (TPR) repeat protein
VKQERWQEIDRVFEAALERSAAERPAFVASECTDDPELLAEVESLIAAHEQHDNFLEQPCRADGLRLISDHDATALIGRIVGVYRIRSRLGAGAHSEVYLGEDLRLARPVAIKLLALRWAADQENVARFRREALAVSALNHPNIVTIYEVGEWQGRNFIVAEYVDGMTLRQYMCTQTPTIASSLEIAFQIANALAAAHGAGIVHRDIKPENIMVRTDGLVKVLDFGIAKVAGPREMAGPDIGPATATGVVIGTFPYMSPEQARAEAVDARSDLWSLGVVLYEMLASRLPFPGDTAADHIAAILQRAPEPIGKLRRDLPPGVEALVARMLAKNRSERYSDAGALAKRLGQLRTAVRDRRWVDFRPSQRLVGSFLALVLASAAVWEFRHLRRTDVRGEVIQVSGRETNLSLAVLPLLVEGGGSDMEYLSDGITDGLINELSGIPEIKVLSRNSAFRYKGQIVDARKVGETLGVRVVLLGKLVLLGDTVTVNVEMVDTRDRRHIWGNRYQRKLANIVDLQQDVARGITETMRLRPKGDEIRLSRPHTMNPEAYQLYLHGLFYWMKETPEDFRKSCTYFQRAVEVDRNYALAYAGLGNYYGFASAQGLMNPDEGWPKAEAAISKALELDPRLSDAQHGAAALHWIYRRNWAAAEREFVRAIQLNANDAEAHNHYSGFLVARGRFDEGIEEIRRALELDPLSTRYITNLGRTYFYARRYDAAIRQYRLALELDSKNGLVHELLGEAYARAGAERTAVAEWQSALTLAGESTVASAVGRVYTRNGLAAAVRMLGQHELKRCARRTENGQFVPAIDYARAYIRLGKPDSRGAVSFRGGTVDIGETSASSRCSCRHCSKRF